MGVYLSKRADYVKLYLALWLVAFMGLWVNFFREFSEPFRVTTISYFLVYLAVLIGAYFILAPLLKNRAITSEKSKWLPFLPALLLLLHWLFQQMDLMFAPGGRLDYFSFTILVNPLFILFLFLGLVLYLLAAQPQIMDAVFVGMKNTIRLFVAFAFLALGLISLAQIIQAVSALAKIGAEQQRLGQLFAPGRVLDRRPARRPAAQPGPAAGARSAAGCCCRNCWARPRRNGTSSSSCRGAGWAPCP